MALYALGDMHLSFTANMSQERFGKIWKNHEQKIEKNCRTMILPEDTFVITGDHSWGKNLSEAEADLRFIENLPGNKILLRGNHDMFWDAKKTARLNAQFEPGLHFLQNNYYTYRDYALVGTKGYTFEGPFRVNAWGRIIDWDENEAEHAEKLVKREYERLKAGFDLAQADGYRKFIMFLHYPPTNILQTESAFTKIAEEYGAEHVVYSHCHGQARFGDSIRGNYHGISYHLVSGDYLNFRPEKILD